MRFLLLLLLLISFPTWANTPIPSKNPLKEVEKKMKDTETEKKRLQSELKNIDSELASQKNKLVSVAKDIKKNEQTLIKLEQSIGQKQDEQRQIEDKLNEDKKSISDLVLALERIRRVPPEAVLARPESPLKTAQSSMLLKSILPRVYKRADQLKTDLEKLKIIITSLEQDRNEALHVSKKLQESKKNLNAMLSQREKTYALTEQNIKTQQAELNQISLQAKSLKDLVRRIEEKQRQEDQRRKEEAKKSASQTTIPKSTPIPSAGSGQLPASGTILVDYGKTDEIGAISQGIKIKSLPNALIVAPMGGVVDYAGNFKGYGQIIILKHQKGYHSLIAGLGKIDTVVGRAVTAGEPIGRMANYGENDAKQTLYYELRYQGQPVNPSKKISGLK